MLKHLAVGLVVLAGSVVAAHAGPKEDILAAVQKLGSADNYSWDTTIEGGFGGGQSGKTQKDGLTNLSLEMRDNSVEVFMKGKKVAIKMDDQWQTLEEAIQSGADNGGGFNPTTMIGRMISRFRVPTNQAAGFLDQLTNYKPADGGFTADFTPDAAKAQVRPPMGRRGQGGPGGGPGGPGGGPGGPGGGPPGGGQGGPPAAEVKDAAATAQFWIDKDGYLTKVQIHVTGTVTVNDEDRDIDRTTTIEIKDIGTTKIDVPKEAADKLG